MRGLSIAFLWALSLLDAHAQESLQQVTDKLLAHPFFKGSSVGIHVAHAASGKTVFEYQADRLLTPASNQKLLTTAVAWQFLGPEDRMRTVLSVHGEIKDSTLYGEIRLDGDGDPSLGSGRYGPGSHPDSIIQRWTRVITSLGIKRIAGSIRCVPERFPGSPVGLTWEWDDLGGCFAPGHWPINWLENCLPVTLDRAGDEYKLLGPDGDRLPWRVMFVPDSTSDVSEPSFLSGGPESGIRWIGGPPQMAFPVAFKISITDPPAHVVHLLGQSLKAAGVAVDSAAQRPQRSALITSDTIWSPYLWELCTSINAFSRNLYAEAVYRRLGSVWTKYATADGGKWAIQSWLRRSDLDEFKPAIYDGSGLSRHNALSAELLTRVLVRVHAESIVYAGFRETLAKPGGSGTLRSFLVDKNLKGKVWAKTGSLNRIRTLSGYLETRNGDLLAFSFLANQFGGLSPDFFGLVQQFLLALSSYESPK